jgi:FAD/FMN-containing dehydrogenase
MKEIIRDRVAGTEENPGSYLLVFWFHRMMRHVALFPARGVATVTAGIVWRPDEQSLTAHNLT